MTSQIIDSQIAALAFDETAFKEGIDASLKDLDRMIKGLKLDNVTQGIDNLEKKVNGLGFGAIGDSIDSVLVRLSTMGTVGFAVITRMTNAVIDFGKSMFESFVSQPMMTGLSEYETQINAIQTILSNTRKAGTSLSDVTNALDQLNTYADLTIYNFTQMTKNIGTFTAAGIDLETAVSAIKGIANLGAVSGSDANQVSNAMYQMSQALSTGTVKLMDWNSIVNAGMGGEIFKSLLIDVANVGGTIQDNWQKINDLTDGAGVTSDNFRSTLEAGWVTSGVLLDSLKAISGELSVIDLMDMGFSEDKAKEIFALGQDAVDAATKVKTFTQLIDVAKEAMQSGWSQTWRIIIGDFGEAKETFTGLSSMLGTAISESADARNKFWSVWVTRGGREEVLKIIYGVFETIINTVKNFQNAVGDVFKPFKGWQLYNITKSIADFVEKFKMASESGDRFKSIIRGIASIFDIFRMLIVAVLTPILGMKDGVVSLGDSFISFLAYIGDVIFGIRNVIKDTNFFSKALGILYDYFQLGITIIKNWFIELSKTQPIKDLVKLWNDLDYTDVLNFFNWIKGVALVIWSYIDSLITSVKSFGNAILELEPVKKVLNYISETFTYNKLKEFIETMISKMPIVKAKFETFYGILETVVDKVKAFFSGFDASGMWESFINYINTFDGSSITSFFETVKGYLKDIPSLSEIFNTNDLSINFESIGKSLGSALKSLGAYLTSGDIDLVGLANVIGVGLLGYIAVAIKNFSQGGWLESIFNSLFGESSTIGESVVGAFSSIETAVTSWQNNIKADTLQKIAIALGIVAASALALSLIDKGKLAGAVASMTVLMSALFGGLAVISKFDLKNIALASVGILLISGSLLVLALAMALFSTMSPEETGNGLVIAALAIAGFVATVKSLTSGGNLKGILSASLALSVLAVGLIAMSYAIKVMAAIPTAMALKGMSVMAGVMVGFGAFVKLVNGGEALLAAVAITILSGAMLIMSEGLKRLGSLGYEEIARGLIALGGSLAILVIAVNAMTTGLVGAVAMVIVSGAILLLAHAMKILSSLTWDSILVALGALAGVFVVLGLAGLILSPLIPSLIGLGLAMALIGVGALALGYGLALAATGLVLIAGASGAVIAAIVALGYGIALVLPILADALAKAIVSFLTTLALAGPDLLEAAKTLILLLLQAIVEVTPQIVEGLMTLITELLSQLAEHLPDFIASGMSILLSLLQGIEDNIGLVTEKAVGIITKFIEGLANSAPDLVAAGFDLINALVGAISDGLVEQTETLVTNALSVGSSVVGGIVQGINNGLSSVVSAASSLGQAALDSFKSIFDINSPARTTYRIASHVVNGLYNGLSDGKTKLVSMAGKLAQGIQNGMSLVLNNVADALENSSDYRPKITPVLNLDGIRKDSGRISGMLNSSNYAMAVGSAFNKRQTEAISNNATTESQRGSVTFIQTINSPKPLTPREIYRQTESQIEKLKGR